MAGIINPIRPDVLVAVTGENEKVKVIDIGPWNMDVDNIKLITHGLDWDKILGIWGWVRNDADTFHWPFSMAHNNDNMSLFVYLFTSTQIHLYIRSPGFFDQADFSGVAFSRGRLNIFFED